MLLQGSGVRWLTSELLRDTSTLLSVQPLFTTSPPESEGKAIRANDNIFQLQSSRERSAMETAKG